MQQEIDGSDGCFSGDNVAIRLRDVGTYVDLRVSQINIVLATTADTNSIGLAVMVNIGLYFTHLPLSILVWVGSTLNRSSSDLTHSQDCGCMKAILIEYVVEFLFLLLVSVETLDLPSLSATRLITAEWIGCEAFYTFSDASLGRFLYTATFSNVTGDINSSL